MGRIYKALAKSLQERQARESEPTVSGWLIGNKRLGNEETAATNDRYRYAGFGFSQPAPSRVVEFQSPATVKAPISGDEVINLLDNVLEESLQTEHRDASRHLQIAPWAAPAFAEPKQIADLDGTDIEPHLIALTGSDPGAAENYRTLAVRLLNMTSSKNQKLKTLVITSAQGREGKTTVATNLAWVMAKQAERRVLLIDANLQNPSVGAYLGLAPQQGWLDMVDKKVDLAEAAIRLDPNGLYILSPRGKRLLAAREPSHAVASMRVEKLFEEFAEYFDFIVIDAPAMLDSADAQRLVSIADGTVLVSRADHTPHSRVTEALKHIPKPCRVGIVLNEAQA